jgi:hypothetical protein
MDGPDQNEADERRDSEEGDTEGEEEQYAVSPRTR